MHCQRLCCHVCKPGAGQPLWWNKGLGMLCGQVGTGEVEARQGVMPGDHREQRKKATIAFLTHTRFWHRKAPPCSSKTHTRLACGARSTLGGGRGGRGGSKEAWYMQHHKRCLRPLVRGVEAVARSSEGPEPPGLRAQPLLKELRMAGADQDPGVDGWPFSTVCAREIVRCAARSIG